MTDHELIEKLLTWQKINFYSSAQLREALQINKNTLTNWKQGKPLSPKTRVKITNLISSEGKSLTEENNVAPQTEKVQKYPVISEAAAATINTTYFPASEFAQVNADEFVSFSDGRKGDFVIRVIGNSMAPWYPAGTLLLVRPNVCLKNGDRVIAVLADGTTLFKTFAEDGDFFYLMSENQIEGKDYKFAKKDFNGVRALYLVLQSMRNERTLDSEKAQQGIPPEWKKRMEAIK